MTFKTLLIAVTAVAALLGAALMAVPSAGEEAWVCLDLGCLSF